MLAEALRKIQERQKKKAILNTCRTRASKAAAQQQYTRAHKEVRRSIKRDKRSHIKNLAKHAEEAAARGNMRDVYNTTKKLSARYQLTGKQIKDKEGKTLTSVEEPPKRWAELFSELLNRPERDRDRAAINCGKPTRQEIRKAIQSLKNGRAAGPDDVPTEALKVDIGTSTEALYRLFRPFGRRKRF